MPKFALQLNEYANGEVLIYNLVVDGVDQFYAFEDSLEDQFLSEFKSFGAIIYQISHKKTPAKGKRRIIKGVEGGREMKSRNLRLYYLVIKELGIVVCLGANKKTQKKDLKRLDKIRKAIVEQIKKNGKPNIQIKEENDDE